MESGKSTDDLTTREGNSHDGNNMQLVLTVMALVLAVVALIVGCIGLSQRGTTNINVPATGTSAGTMGSNADKIWAVALGHANYNEAYIDEESGELRGFLVDLTNAVCRAANKNCRIVYDIWQRCWDSEEGQVARGGIGLMGNWYDACAGWVQTYDRSRTVDFSEPFGKTSERSLYVKAGSPHQSNWKDMTGKTIGIIDGWSTDEFCLKRNEDQFTGGVPFIEANFVHYTTVEELIDSVNNEDVDFAFASESNLAAHELQRVDGNPDLPCTLQGPGMMVRKVAKEFLDWFNPTLVQLKRTNEYKVICNDLEEEHGHIKGRTKEDYCFL